MHKIFSQKVYFLALYKLNQHKTFKKYLIYINDDFKQLFYVFN